MEGKNQKLLLIEESPLGRGTMEELLHACKDQDFELHKALDLQSAKRVLQRENISIVLLDVSGKKDCEHSVKKIYELVDHIPVIVVSNKSDAEIAVNAARNGAQEYLSKKNLSSEMLMQTLFSAIERKRIERELRIRGAILEAISFAAEKFLNNPDWESYINEVLQKLGHASQSDRAYIFENKFDKKKVVIPDLVAKWVAPDIGRWQSVSEMKEHSDQKIGYQRWVKILQKGEIIHTKVGDLPHQEQISLKGLNIQSLLVVPITVENCLWGILGFDQCSRQRTWAQLEIEALKTAASIIAAAISRARSDAHVKHLATHDYLTDLPNRALFEDRLRQAMARADRSAKWVAIMIIDLDHFKKVNDSYGHPVGDQALKQIGKRLIKAVRTSDTVARIGGDEFVVVAEEINSSQDIAIIGNKIMSQLSEPLLIDGKQIEVSASIGASVYPEDSRDFEQLMKYADIALYKAKESGSTYKIYLEIGELRHQKKLPGIDIVV